MVVSEHEDTERSAETVYSLPYSYVRIGDCDYAYCDGRKIVRHKPPDDKHNFVTETTYVVSGIPGTQDQKLKVANCPSFSTGMCTRTGKGCLMPYCIPHDLAVKLLEKFS